MWEDMTGEWECGGVMTGGGDMMGEGCGGVWRRGTCINPNNIESSGFYPYLLFSVSTVVSGGL